MKLQRSVVKALMMVFLCTFSTILFAAHDIKQENVIVMYWQEKQHYCDMCVAWFTCKYILKS